jgi:hypothetical protein
MDNPYWCTYGNMPNCAYLIDQSGKIFYREPWFANGPTKTPDSSALESKIRELLGSPQNP